MKKNIKLILFILVILTVTGCTSNIFIQAYKKMQASEKGINGYVLDLRIYGTINNSKVSEIVKITNYMNKDYKILKTIIESDNSGSKPIRKEDVKYIFSNTVYKLDDTNKYVVTTEDIKYSQPDLYMVGIKNAKIVGKKVIKTIGDKKFDVYNVTFDKKDVEKLAINTAISALTIPKTVKGEIYIDSSNYLYRITYLIDTVTINASYFGINNVSKINLPN